MCYVFYIDYRNDLQPFNSRRKRNNPANFSNHGYEPQGKPWTLIPPQGAGYYTLRLWRDCSQSRWIGIGQFHLRFLLSTSVTTTYKFQYTSFLKFESHNKYLLQKFSFVTQQIYILNPAKRCIDNTSFFLQFTLRILIPFWR